jgi:hypothetical protein
VLLRFSTDGVFDHIGTPRFLQVGAFPEHFLLEVVGKSVLGHAAIWMTENEADISVCRTSFGRSRCGCDYGCECLSLDRS